MCSRPSPDTPPVVRRDPEAEARQAAAQGAALSNQQLAFRRRRRRSQTLLSHGAAGYGGPAAPSLLATAQPGEG